MCKHIVDNTYYLHYLRWGR